MARYIDADEAKKDLDERGFDFFTSEQDIDEAQRWLDEQPAQDVEPVTHAEWIYDSYQDKPFVCSSCGWFTDDDIFRKFINYCPLCGAKMDERGG